MKQGAFNFL